VLKRAKRLGLWVTRLASIWANGGFDANATIQQNYLSPKVLKSRRFMYAVDQYLQDAANAD
jgi:hypothetical protein